VTGVWGVNFNPDKTDEIFDEWGAEGWELVSAFSVNDGAGYSKEIVFIFKRPF
jgi:hypothetical protein